MTRIRKAVFPVAGLGTRFLPATKAIPKELATVVDRPVLQYAVEEARAAGIEEFIFVNSLGKSALENHFDRDLFLEQTLEKKGKTKLLEAVREAAIPDGQMIVVRQHAPLGLGHAVWCARNAVGNEPFAVLLPDEVLVDPPCLPAMVAAHESVGGAVLATMPVAPELTKKYGILDPDGAEGADGLIPAKGMVEKPDPAEAPSNQSLIGRYVLPPEVFEALDKGERGAGGEIQLTDAIAQLVGRLPVHGFSFKGERHDCGSMDGFVKANLALGLKREELREDLTAYMRDLLGSG
ncbi:MAG: UTP--glucose-1-phosphate uridylyltransferase [Pseudomonadota bacterium]